MKKSYKLLVFCLIFLGFLLTYASGRLLKNYLISLNNLNRRRSKDGRNNT